MNFQQYKRKVIELQPINIQQGFYKLRNLWWNSPLKLFNAVCIETTSICNRKCSFCPNSKYDRGKHFMPMGLIKKIIDDLADMNYKGKICPHFYGEPLIDKRLVKIVKYASNKLPECKIVIYSNGDLLTKELFEKLIYNGVDMFEITQYDEKPSRAMKKIMEHKLFKRYVDYRKEITYENRGGLLDIEPMLQRKRCFFNALIVNYKGDVLLCCNDYLGKYSFGNIRYASIQEIWNKPYFIQIREECEKGIFNLDICKRCVGEK